jgi:SAM-dependent methyltransferase
VPGDPQAPFLSDAVQQRYAEVTYPGGAFANTHPARLAALAGLFGLATPPVRTARVLELGCAQGYNLLPMAQGLPEARFVGVDFSNKEIAAGSGLAVEAGLKNVELVCADLRTFSPGEGAFDFVIAHGVLSWVPDDVKEAVFAICSRALAPDGLALISYNTYPGWKQREALRDLMLMRAASTSDAAGRLEAARTTLDTLDRLLDGRAETHAAHNRDIIASMRAKTDGHFYHDDLDGVNDPCYFLQFVEWAGERGLDYVTECGAPMLGVEFLPAAMREPLAGLDRLLFEQHLDFALNRTFRSSLVCRAGRTINAHPDPSALRGFRFGSPLAPPPMPVRLSEGVPVRFGGSQPLAFESSHPLVKALFTTLAEGWPRRMSYQELMDGMATRLRAAGLPVPSNLDHALPLLLLEGCGRRQLDFLADCGPGNSTVKDGRRHVPLLTRLMSSRGLPVVNAWHEMIPLENEVRQLVATLDGSRDAFTPNEMTLLQKLASAGFLDTPVQA